MTGKNCVGPVNIVQIQRKEQNIFSDQ